MVVASRNDGFVLASDCADVKRMSLHCQVFELHSYDLAVLAQFYAGQYQLAIVSSNQLRAQECCSAVLISREAKFSG